MMPSPMTWLTVPSYWWTACIIRSSTGSRSLRASSGSRSARSSIEPLTSAKRTVTCLRSPSMALFEVRIFSARCLGMYESGEAKRDCVPPPATGCAQAGQNFAVADSEVRHFEQTRSSGAPQPPQNLSCAAFSEWHRGHCMRGNLPGGEPEDHPPVPRVLSSTRRISARHEPRRIDVGEPDLLLVRADPAEQTPDRCFDRLVVQRAEDRGVTQPTVLIGHPAGPPDALLDDLAPLDAQLVEEDLNHVVRVCAQAIHSGAVHQLVELRAIRHDAQRGHGERLDHVHQGFERLRGIVVEVHPRDLQKEAVVRDLVPSDGRGGLLQDRIRVALQ